MDASAALAVSGLACIAAGAVAWLQARHERALLRTLERMDALENVQRILLAADKSNVARLNGLEERTAGVEALLVSTVGQETEGFCRQMDALMERMDKPEPEPAKAGRRRGKGKKNGKEDR